MRYRYEVTHRSVDGLWKARLLEINDAGETEIAAGVFPSEEEAVAWGENEVIAMADTPGDDDAPDDAPGPG